MEVNDRIVNVILISQIHDLRSDPWKKMCLFPKICQQFFQFQHLEPFWIGVAHRLHLFNLPRRRYSWNRTWIQHDCTRRRSTVVYCVQLVSRQHTAKRFQRSSQRTQGLLIRNWCSTCCESKGVPTSPGISLPFQNRMDNFKMMVIIMKSYTQQIAKEQFTDLVSKSYFRSKSLHLSCKVTHVIPWKHLPLLNMASPNISETLDH